MQAVKRSARNILTEPPAVMRTDAPPATRALAKVVGRLAADIAFREAALEMHGPTAVRLAMRGRSLRELAKSCGLSPTYLSRVETGGIVVSPAALLALLRECEGVGLTEEERRF